MNTRQLQYSLLLAKEQSFSAAAKKLNISQPALSKHIQQLETQLGIKLFNRDTSPLTLTPAGEQFILKAQDMLYQEEQLMRTLERFRTGEGGRLTIGVSPFRNLYLMPEIVGKIHAKYPRIQVQLCESNSAQLKQDAAEGKFDFAIVNLPVDDSLLDVIPLQSETLALAVPNSMLHLLKDHTLYKEVDFSQCEQLPFVVVSPTQEMRVIFDKLCAAADFHPNIAVEVHGGVISAWSMARAGIGATVLPLQFLRSGNLAENLSLFPLKDNAYSRQPVIVTRKRQFLSEYAKYAIELLSGSEAE